MKKIIVKEVVLPVEMEYHSNSYPGDGIYWLMNLNQLAVVSRGSCMLANADPSLIVDDVVSVSVGGGLSESFVLALIDTVAELVKYQAPRVVRNTDDDSDVMRMKFSGKGSDDAKGEEANHDGNDRGRRG